MLFSSATTDKMMKARNESRHKLMKSWSFKENFMALRRGRSLLSSPDISHISPKQNLTDRNCSYNPASSGDVWRALCPMELPDAAIHQLLPHEFLSSKLFASLTGPKTGLLAVNKWNQTNGSPKPDLKNWINIENRKAHGISISLYEKNSLTGKNNGDPIADAFVVRARQNSAFLAVADGVNWGKESMKAARCAIYSIFTYLERHLFGPDSSKTTLNNTQDAAQLLFETFSFAQEQIIRITTGLTTLCVALILPLWTEQTNDHFMNKSNSPKCNDEFSSSQFAVIVASVGDSQAFLISKFHGIREITGWIRLSSTLNSRLQPNVKDDLFTKFEPHLRDFRDTGGALGAVYKNNKPELNNLICAVTLCDPGDIVLLGSDGLIDNFDPVITKIAVPESPHLDFVDEDDAPDEVFKSSTECHYSHRTEKSFTESLSSLNSSNGNIYPIHSTKPWLSPIHREISIWPRPPPPPSPSIFTSDPLEISQQYSKPTTIKSIKSHSMSNSPTENDICAREINFTNKLELNWFERRRYTSKELERVWHELDVLDNRNKSNSTNKNGGTISARDLCEALINHVLLITSNKRELLEDRNFLQFHSNKLVNFRNGNTNNNNNYTKKLDYHNLSEETQKQWFLEMLKRLPGKLDHATCVAYEIGVYHGDENEVYEENAHRYFIPIQTSPIHTNSVSQCEP